MANHAYVYATKQEITPERVVELAKQFNEQVLHGLMEFREIEPGKWFLWHDDYNAIQFWITDDFQLDEEDPTSRAIEFRHGHGNQFMWWADIGLEHWLGEHLQGSVIDEGDWAPEPASFTNYTNYERFEQVEMERVQRWLKNAEATEEQLMAMLREYAPEDAMFIEWMRKKKT